MMTDEILVVTIINVHYVTAAAQQYFVIGQLRKLWKKEMLCKKENAA